MTAAGGTISVLVGAVLLRLTITGEYERYVRRGMGTWLLVAGVLVVALGLVTLVRAVRGGTHEHDHEDDHDEHGVGVGWLLLAPIAALLLVAPPTLGSFGVDRGASVDVRAGAPVFTRLPRRAAPLEMSLLEFGQRAFDHGGSSFNRQTVRLTGFAAGPDGGGFRLARYEIACCAADAIPVVVRVVGAVSGSPARDQWVTVTGTFVRTTGEIPEIAATSIADIQPPEDPYE